MFTPYLPYLATFVQKAFSMPEFESTPLSRPSDYEEVEPVRSVHPRRLARECVAQGLYQWLMTGDAASVIRLQILERAQQQAIKLDLPFFHVMWEGAMIHATALQAIIEAWLDRPWHEVSYVERAVLLLGAYELVHCPDVPLRVVINEALEVNKTFGGAEGHRYVNSILDRCASAYRLGGI